MFETILERTINGIVMQCGYVKVDDDELVPAVSIAGKIELFDDITKARATFWNSVNH